jgi:trehalose 2-sulfotransferase
MRDPYHERHDTDRREPTPADGSYVVCATMRSGSNLLCEGLMGTGLAGVPAEYFNPRQRARLTERWGCGDTTVDYIHELRARRSGPHGVFGLKLHSHQMRNLDALDMLLPGAVYISLRRRDIDAQAVSLWTASETRQFFREPGAADAPGTGPPVRYSYAGILSARRSLVAGMREWDQFFDRQAHVPIEVVYEQLAADYEGEVRRVLAGILPGAPDRQRRVAAVQPPGVARQSDERSAELIARFVEERTRRGDRDLGARQLARRVRRGLARATASTRVAG